MLRVDEIILECAFKLPPFPYHLHSFFTNTILKLVKLGLSKQQWDDSHLSFNGTDSLSWKYPQRFQFAVVVQWERKTANSNWAVQMDFGTLETTSTTISMTVRQNQMVNPIGTCSFVLLESSYKLLLPVMKDALITENHNKQAYDDQD